MFYERIPVKTQAVSLTGESVEVDAAGLEVTLYAANDIFIKANESVPDENAYLLTAGNTAKLSGRFFIKADEADVRLLYCKLL